MTMLSIQSLPYVATLITACVSAISYRRMVAPAPVILLPAAAGTVEPVLPKAA
jgi:hypothetical protein